MRDIIIIGAGGYSKSVIDSLDKKEYRVAGFIDENTEKKSHLGFPVLASSIEGLKMQKGDFVFFVAIGNNKKRKKWFDELKKRNLEVISVVDKTAIVSKGAKVGEGCFIGKMAIVNNGSVVGDNCVVNTRSLVEHGCRVSSHVNISTNTVINGDVIVGEGSFLGSSSVTIGQIKIGKWSTVGAGAVVIRDVEDEVTVAGVPAKIISKTTMLG